MIKIKTLLLIALMVYAPGLFAQVSCPVIPEPLQYEQSSGTFKINKYTTVRYEDESFKPLAHFLQKALKRYNNIAVKVNGKSKTNSIILSRMFTQSNDSSAYSVSIKPGAIVVSASSGQGMFYGIISLLQLARQAPVHGNNSIALNCWEIHDRPQYAWRGLMLDESRHFFGKETVKELLDWMAFYKLNRFHWHLTDEPAWRLQIKQYPKLTSVGARGNTTDSLAPARYYTQHDIEEIVQYAKARFITVIPEIDMPGHATASNRAYPAFSGGGTGKFANFTFNPGKNSTYQYLANILKETAGIFPSGMVHIGGDEVSFGSKSWESDDSVKYLMKQYHLTNLEQVEKYFIRRMADTALRFNQKVLAWDEAADNTLPVDSTIIFWWRQDQPKQLTKALQKGYSVVLCPRLPFYFDFVQDSLHRKGRKWNRTFNALQSVYGFSLGNYFKDPPQSKQILGMQANLWTETVVTKKRLDFLLFPRMAALAEAAWTDPDKKDYDRFLLRLKGQLPLYQKENMYYYDPFDPQDHPEPLQ